MNGEYRKGVGIFLLNKENKLWVGKRIDFKSNFWQMPQNKNGFYVNFWGWIKKLI